MSEGASPAAGPADAPLQIDVRRGDPTPDELAALMAVVSEAYAREAADAVADDSPTASAWTRRQRMLRGPLPRGVAWGRFTG